MLSAISLYMLIGLAIGLSFGCALWAKAKSDKSRHAPLAVRLRVYSANVVVVLIAFAVLIIGMKFARDYQPNYWSALIALLITWVVTTYVFWRRVVRS